MTLLTPGQMERLKRDTAIYREFKEKLRNPVTEKVNGQKVTVMPNRTGVLQALMARYRIHSLSTMYKIIQRMEAQEKGVENPGADDPC
ncbi:hypothetical protein, partial [Duncaniella muris]